MTLGRGGRTGSFARRKALGFIRTSQNIFQRSTTCNAARTPIFWPSMFQDFDPERRAAMRYRLKLPVIFHWNDGTDRTEGGFTCDVAVDGALIFSRRCPPVGADVRIEVLVPSPDDSAEEIRIGCIGKVNRVWEQQGSTYFGVQGSFNDDQLTRHVML